MQKDMSFIPISDAIEQLLHMQSILEGMHSIFEYMQPVLEDIQSILEDISILEDMHPISDGWQEIFPPIPQKRPS
jgi:hypothetical protein